MNKRIGNLIYEANRATVALGLYPIKYGEIQEIKDIIVSNRQQQAKEILAESIVRECADFIAAGEFGDSAAAKQLREYFGVTE